MIIIIAHCDNGYYGCDSDKVFFFDDGTSEKMINEDIYCWAVENADNYSYVHFGCDGEYDDEEEYEDYIENYVYFDWHYATYDEYLSWCEKFGYEPKSEEEVC